MGDVGNHLFIAHDLRKVSESCASFQLLVIVEILIVDMGF